MAGRTLGTRWSGLCCLPLVLLAAAGPGLLSAQAEVTAIAQGTEALDLTDDVKISRLSFTEEIGVNLGTTLEPGDMLSSISGATDVELACGEDTVLRFGGGFRVLINFPSEVDCAVDFLAGTLDVLADQPTEIDSGGVILGSEGTQFSVELTVEDGEPDRQLLVFDGKVRVRTPEVEREVAAGGTWNKKGVREAIWGQVSESQIDRVAERYAKLDAALGDAALTSPEDKSAKLEQLKRLHSAILKEPEDVATRAELAKEQLKSKRTPQALYHLKRGGLTSADELERYEIDTQVVEEMATPLTEVNKSWSLRVAPQLADPRELIKSKRYEEAIALLEAAAEPDSRTYYGLAQAYLGLEGIRSRRAHAYAERALRLATTDRELSPVELNHCRRIAALAGREQ